MKTVPVILSSGFLCLACTLPVSALTITGVTDNSGSGIPRYAKLEITFQIPDTVAENLQFPHDPAPPAYVSQNGISVDALFLPPGQTDWANASRQPGFYYHDYLYDRNNLFKPSWADDGHNRLSFEWYYPTLTGSWKVRFAPTETGTWQYRLTATDASGSTTEASPHSFTVGPSASPGFIKVSATDPRYFGFSDGTPFIPRAIQSQVPSINPFGNMSAAVALYAQNGINLNRTWSSGLFGTAFLEWVGGRNIFDGYLPRPGTEAFRDPVSGQTQLTIALRAYTATDWYDACRFRFDKETEPVKQNTNYRFQIRYQASCLKPADPSQPYGLVGKVAVPNNQWLAACHLPGTGQPVTTFGHDTNGWATVEGTWNSGSLNFIPRFGFALQNIQDNQTANCTSPLTGTWGGKAWIDSVSLREDLGGGEFGPEIFIEPSLRYDTYFKDFYAFRFDQALEALQDKGVYLKIVLQDKNDMIYYKLNDDGSYVLTGPDNQDGFYGIGRTFNKTRWLQKAYWRYTQARWGYSTAIHSWEVTNEGDPWNSNHYVLADEMGQAMRSFAPNNHLSTTSFWHSFPAANFWGNAAYPNVDYADVHVYHATGWLKNPLFDVDTAVFHLDYSRETRSAVDWYTQKAGLPTKPIIRGETAIGTLNGDGLNPAVLQDTSGVWLHTFLWSTLDPGALAEEYWQLENEIRNGTGPDGVAGSGLWEVYRYFSDFLKDIPINNGRYVDAQAATSSAEIQWIGQKDPVNNRAHLWLRNRDFIWRNVVDQTGNFTGLTGTVSLTGFSPNLTLPVEWHKFTVQGIPAITASTAATDGTGRLTLNLPADPGLTDVGLKIGNYGSDPSIPGDYTGDNHVDYRDLLEVVRRFSTRAATIFDYNQVIAHFIL